MKHPAPRRLRLLAFLLFSWAAPLSAQSEDISASYAWKRMKIGGGGYVTGLDISPAEKDLVYVRTDVAGAYRWDPAAAAWRQLVTTKTMPAGVLSYGKHGGVDSLVGAPSDPNVAYMAFAATPYGGGDGQIYRSLDRGETWTASDFLRHKVKMEPNGEGRQEGERLAVDPADRDVVYFGSISHGLWTTADGGGTWARVPAIPAGTPEHGVNTVVFDGASGTADGKTRVIYVTVMGGGVYRTANAGRDWARISDAGPGDAGKPRDAAIGRDRSYYVAYDNQGGATGSVWRYSPDGTWTDITPPPPAGGNKAWWAVAVNPADPAQVVAMIQGGRCFVSSDQGASWTSHGFRLVSPEIRWQREQSNHYLSVGQLAFDPFAPGRLWFAEGFGVWRATLPVTTPEIEWRTISEGIEETCGNDLVAPPGGRPVAAMWDLGVVHFSDPDSYSAEKSPPGFMSAWALDWCATEPTFLVGVLRSQVSSVPHPRSSGYSTDGGRSWTRFAALVDGTAPPELDYGVIAVSADSPDNIVWAPSGKKLPYFTKDRGATWTRATMEGVTATGFGGHYSPQKPLSADRVSAGTFYFYHPDAGMFRSTDGGAHFARLHATPQGGRTNAILKSTPGKAGHLWFAAGFGGGLARSTDGGATWESVPAPHTIHNVGLGKARREDAYPTLFVAGMERQGPGVFRSTDEGRSWERISGYPLGVADWIDAVEGDKDVFGRVYIGFAGSGFAYGQVE